MQKRATTRNLHLKAAFEAEFSLTIHLPKRGYRPYDDAVCFSSIAMTLAAPVINDLITTLKTQKLTVEQYYPKTAHNQHEISIHHNKALRTTDNQLTIHKTIHNITYQHGLYTS